MVSNALCPYRDLSVVRQCLEQQRLLEMWSVTTYPQSWRGLRDNKSHSCTQDSPSRYDDYFVVMYQEVVFSSDGGQAVGFSDMMTK